MRIFLASARLEDIHWAWENGLVDGVLTSDAELRHAAPDGDADSRLRDLTQATTLPICTTVRAIRADDIYTDARDLARLSDRLIVQIPFFEEALSTIRRLSAEGVRVAATFIFTAAQALLAAKAGALGVHVPIDTLDGQGLDGVPVLAEISSVFDLHGIECDVAAIRPHNSAQFTDCAMNGADMVAVTTDVLRGMLVHPLTDRALDGFLADLGSRPRVPVAP